MPATLTDTLAEYTDQCLRRVRYDDDSPLSPLAALRQAALEHLTETGLPTPRDEDWRYMNLAPITRSAFPVAPIIDDAVRHDALAPYLLGEDIPRIVLVNGRVAPELSCLDDLPTGVHVLGIRDGLAADLPAIAPHLTHIAHTRGHAFVSLNTALFADGAIVWVERDVTLDTPVHVLHVSVPSATPAATHARNLFVIDQGAQVNVAEDYITVGTGTHFTNAVTELVAGANSRVAHARVVRESPQSLHIGSLRTRQARDTQITSHAVAVGGAAVRHDIHATLGGQGADCGLHGLSVLRGAQHVDNHLRVVHARPHGSSREIFRGVLDDAARASFCGRIVVQPGAQKTDAKQTNQNLLLSGKAQADSRPQLEIYADDVKCTHGATTGQVDDDAIFYLRSRGVPKQAARSLLVYAFARESLDTLRVAALRAQLDRAVRERLPHAEWVQELA